jgi:prepilin-type processing-associated H-X9-DG protein
MKARVLPFFEQVAAYNALNFNILSASGNSSYDAPANSTVRTMQISSLSCPSDGNNPSPTVTFNGASVPVASTNYPNSIGTTAVESTSGIIDGPAYYAGAINGPMGPVVTIASVTDGTSNTAIFSEWVRGKNIATQDGTFQVYNDTNDSAKVVTPLLTLYTNCQATPTLLQGGTVIYTQKGSDWLFQHCSNGGCYSHIMTPNKKACFFGGSKTAGHPTATMVGAGSSHPGGVNVGFLDGSVKFIKDSISQLTWWAIATKAGGEVIDASSF